MFDIISGSSHELRKKGYFLGLLDLDRSKEKAEEQIINAIQSKKADGILINGYYVTPAIEKVLLATDFPHICIGKPSFDSMLSWIDTNHSLSSNLAITHLVSLGHKKIAFVGGSDKDNIYRDRFLGYRLSLERNNLSPRDAYVIPTSSNLEEIIQHTTELLRLPEPPDSILCFNSLIAVGVIQAIRQFRLRIPEDISIVSFDNYPYAPLITPSLTVVDIDMYSLGTRAGASLLKKIQNPEMLIQTYTALPHLIQRDSTVLHSET
jgi:LacI family transcriptional regulator